MFQRTYKGTKGKMFFSVLMALLLIVTGCGGQQAEQKSADQTQPAGQTTGNASGGSDKEYVVKHAMGETPIKGTPQRVVVLTAQGVETLVKLGVKPVGAVAPLPIRLSFMSR